MRTSGNQSSDGDRNEARSPTTRRNDGADQPRCPGVLGEVAAERRAQDAKWGEQDHRDGTGRPGSREMADAYRAICKANGPGEDTYQDILAEEVFEAFAETDPAALRTELVQVAAVAVAWVEAIDRRVPPEPAAQGHRFASDVPTHGGSKPTVLPPPASTSDSVPTYVRPSDAPMVTPTEGVAALVEELREHEGRASHNYEMSLIRSARSALERLAADVEQSSQRETALQRALDETNALLAAARAEAAERWAFLNELNADLLRERDAAIARADLAESRVAAVRALCASAPASGFLTPHDVSAALDSATPGAK